MPLSIAWIDAAEQGEWAEAFKAQTPGLVALNPRKRKFAVMKGSFSPRNAYDFIVGLMGPAAGTPGGAAGGAPAPAVTFESIDKLPGLRTQPAVAAPKKAAKSKGKGKGKAAGGKGGKAKKAAPKGAPEAKTEL
jgi:hypothetical protein